MKRFALLFLVAFTALSGYAQTTLTLEDAVLNGRKYYPQGLIMPQWVPGTDAYSHVTTATKACGRGRKIWRRNRTHYRRRNQ